VDVDVLCDALKLPGWQFWVERDADHEWLYVGTWPGDITRPGRAFSVTDRVLVTGTADDEQVVRAIFARIQFLTDHELREHFTLNGDRVFNAHDPDVTGKQHDWFVEQQAAVRGF
jgi:hypothetical protein